MFNCLSLVKIEDLSRKLKHSYLLFCSQSDTIFIERLENFVFSKISRISINIFIVPVPVRLRVVLFSSKEMKNNKMYRKPIGKMAMQM